MSVRRIVVLVAVIVLLSSAALADERQGPSPHIAATHAFLMAWGHEKWDEMKDVSADAVTVKLGDKVFNLEPAARKSEVTMQFPFRGLSTLRNGTEVKAVMVGELALRMGDTEMRGPATVTLKEEAGQFRVVGVSVDGAR